MKNVEINTKNLLRHRRYRPPGTSIQLTLPGFEVNASDLLKAHYPQSSFSKSNHNIAIGERSS